MAFPMSAPESNDEFGANSWLIDEMREAYQSDPQSVDASWRDFFAAEASQGSESPQQAAASRPTTAPKPAAAAKATTAAKPAPQAPKPAAAAPAPKVAPEAKPEPTRPSVEPVQKGGEGTPTNPGSGANLSANAPNPAGAAILKEHFPNGAIHFFWLLVAAIPPTLVAMAAFRLL